MSAEVIRLFDCRIYRERVLDTLEKLIGDSFNFECHEVIDAASIAQRIEVASDKIVEVFPHMQAKRSFIVQQIGVIIQRNFAAIEERV